MDSADGVDVEQVVDGRYAQLALGGGWKGNDGNGDEGQDSASEQDHGETPGEDDGDGLERVVLVIPEPRCRPEAHGEQYTQVAPRREVGWPSNWFAILLQRQLVGHIQRLPVPKRHDQSTFCGALRDLS